MLIIGMIQSIYWKYKKMIGMSTPLQQYELKHYYMSSDMT